MSARPGPGERAAQPPVREAEARLRDEEPLVRVERGNPDPEELAALTAVLLTRAAAVGAEPDDVSRRERAMTHWRRPERARGFRGPRTWQGPGH
ncbi:acyl-CoA carboxylase subunit epsilon [Streptomyces sp. NPDC059909]|uniref:acyl-CoA carboxylase subunit epsilon n=1 Tax=Streptomyces sp. NPDC059909 TaxID=3346998 RepID=UPI0036601796